MSDRNIYKSIANACSSGKKLLAVLIDPEKFELADSAAFLRSLPAETTHLFIGGSSVKDNKTGELVAEFKLYTAKPLVLFPGDVNQLTPNADALLFLSLISGNNPEYLIGQQVKAVSILRTMKLEVIPTGYILIDGGKESAVARISGTSAISQEDKQRIIDLAKAAELSGKRLVYLEAGSGALYPVRPDIISAVKNELNIPLIVGGGIRTKEQLSAAYHAGADMIVMGTAFETN